VAAAASQAAKDAAASSELFNQAVDQGDAQSRYYSLAHSVEEVVKAQPAMLQVCSEPHTLSRRCTSACH